MELVDASIQQEGSGGVGKAEKSTELDRWKILDPYRTCAYTGAGGDLRVLVEAIRPQSATPRISPGDDSHPFLQILLPKISIPLLSGPFSVRKGPKRMYNQVTSIRFETQRASRLPL